MYQVLFRIGQFEIISFGVLVAIGALVGLWLFSASCSTRVSRKTPWTPALPVSRVGWLVRSCCESWST